MIKQPFCRNRVPTGANTEPHHGVGTPLGDEGMGLILWNHGFHQRDSVTDALQHYKEENSNPAHVSFYSGVDKNIPN